MSGKRDSAVPAALTDLPGSLPAPQFFREFLHHESVGSIVLLAATVLALLLANTAVGDDLESFWHTETGFVVGSYEFEQSLLHWIDDGLMAIFFFVIGLEIKRELVVGELASRRKAALPVVAALGGMVVPALVYVAFNWAGDGIRGWGIPMATDIAFALGALAVLGTRVPSSLKVFLVALAIVDDIGAILVIALFYSAGELSAWHAVSGVAAAALLVCNRVRVDAAWPYAVLGLVLWFAILNSGVHATLAGVIVAFAIPVTARLAPLEFTSWTHHRLDEIEDCEVPGAHVLESDAQQLMARDVVRTARYVQAPLQRFEQALVPWVTYAILPLFAFANAGVRLSGDVIVDAVTSPVALGVVFGLLIGKQVGVFGASWLAVRLGLADLPPGVRWGHIHAVGVLAGIGFTMSIFIAMLAFDDAVMVDRAKTAVLAASLLAGGIGIAYLRMVSARPEAEVQE